MSAKTNQEVINEINEQQDKDGNNNSPSKGKPGIGWVCCSILRVL